MPRGRPPGPQTEDGLRRTGQRHLASGALCRRPFQACGSQSTKQLVEFAKWASRDFAPVTSPH